MADSLHCDEVLQDSEQESEDSDRSNNTTPISFDAPSEDSLETLYYENMGDDHNEEYKRVPCLVEQFTEHMQKCIPPGGITNGLITIDRYLTSNTSLFMYRMMKTKWDNLIRLSEISMYVEIMYDRENKQSYHTWCYRAADVTRATIKFCDISNIDLQGVIDDYNSMFFCGTCERFIANNLEKWDVKTLGRVATDLRDKRYNDSAIEIGPEDDLKLEIICRDSYKLKRNISCVSDTDE